VDGQGVDIEEIRRYVCTPKTLDALLQISSIILLFNI